MLQQQTWTAEDDARAQDLLRRGATLEEAGQAVGHNGNQLRHRLKRLNVSATELQRQAPPRFAPQCRPERLGDCMGAPVVGNCHEATVSSGTERQHVATSADDVARLVRLCRGRPQTLGQLCDALDMPPRRVRELAEQAKSQGYSVDVAGDVLAWRNPVDTSEPDVPTVNVAQSTGKRFLLGCASDFHFGSKYCMREQLADYCDKLYRAGARTVLMAGDMLDGCYRHGMWELSHHGWDEQAQDCLESLPRLPGLTYYFIDGNHDLTTWAQTGAVSGARLQDFFRQNGRNDLHYLGASEGNVSLALEGVRRPVRAQAWHPKPGKSYALSYQIQKRIESYAPGTKPDILVCGHWHTAVYVVTRGIHALAAGCFQSPESAFARSLAGGVSCGGWMLSLECTETGTLRHVSAEHWSYYHSEESRGIELEPSA